jgi:hypothetical protein
MNPEKNPLATTELNLPVFDSPRRDPPPRKMTWEEVMDQTEPQRSPERRLRNKNPEPFRMHSPRDGTADWQ